jgi:hypothetical protein
MVCTLPTSFEPKPRYLRQPITTTASISNAIHCWSGDRRQLRKAQKKVVLALCASSANIIVERKPMR